MENLVHKQLMEALVVTRPLNVLKMQELAGVSPIGEADPALDNEPQQDQNVGPGPIEGTEALGDLVQTYSGAEIMDKIAVMYAKDGEFTASKLFKKYAANFRKVMDLTDED